MSTTSQLRHAPASPKRLIGQLLVPAVMILFAVMLIIGVLTMEVPSNATFPGPQFLPTIVAGALLVLSGVQIAATVREHRHGESELVLPRDTRGLGEVPLPGERLRTADQPVLNEEALAAPGFRLAPFLWITVAFALFAVLLKPLGWILAAGALFWCVTRAFGSRHALRDAVIGLTVSSAAYIFFDMILGLNLPSGLLGGL
ncbi:tripartite tricarboxylate transporter TctB family protein [Helcobacillus massiliensis]|uniref:tripartite tricarboxylate transporter TctB family protein n=1 Tax=Helcobacillus massiliensis TaxID=521392 RepID=UPI002883073C|nr:tripartite tricarboxylate transporter TctB family protein [Helcobacillus massiliensis]